MNIQNIQNTYPLHHKEKTPSVNPLIRRITEIKGANGEVATYAGIVGKLAYFMLMVIAGIALALVFKGIGAINVEAVTDEVFASKYAIILVLASMVTFLVLPLLAFVIRKTIPVAGALYCISTGYLLGFILALDPSFGGYMLLAMVLTLSLVFAMSFLFFNGYIKVTNRFRAITTTLFSTMILSGFALLIAYFVPGLKGSVMFLVNNPVLSIASSVGGVIIASMFLLIEFDTVAETVRNRLPKEYEWYAAFGVAFTVVWLYFKALDLIIKIKDARI